MVRLMVPVDEETFTGLQARAAACGLSAEELAGELLEANTRPMAGQHQASSSDWVRAVREAGYAPGATASGLSDARALEEIMARLPQELSPHPTPSELLQEMCEIRAMTPPEHVTPVETLIRETRDA